MGIERPMAAAPWLLIVLMTMAAPAGAADASGSGTGERQGWWDTRNEGWFFYNWTPPPGPEESEEAERDTPAPTAQAVPYTEALASPDAPLEDPMAALEALREKAEEAHARALLRPTEENLTEHLTLQKAILARTALHADMSRRIGWTRPEFDPRRRRPSTPAGVQSWSKQREASRVAALDKLSEKYGLFFFFRSDCGYCEEFAPFLKRWSERRGFEVVAVTLDGGALPEFPDPRYMPEVARRLQVERVPALYLADPDARETRPIGFGILSLSELERRIFRLTQMEPGTVIYESDTTGVRP